MDIIKANDMEPNELPDDLANIRYKKTYTEPSSYFDGLADDIMGKINLPLVSKLPFSAPPANYFTNLADAVLSKIKNKTSSESEVQKELNELEPLLTYIPKTNVYRAPQGYFESFTVPIPATKKPAPVIKLRSRRAWMNYAAAAVITGMIGIGIIFSVREYNNANNRDNYTQALAKVSDNDIAEYLDRTSPAADVDLMQTSVEGNNVTDGESLFRNLLDDVSDNDIQNYLNETSDGDEKNIKGI